MAKFILGRKIGMTRVFQEDGIVVPVTLIAAGPVTVTQIRQRDKNGYEAVQVGFGKAKKLNKGIKEFRMPAEGLKRGDVLDVSVFEAGDVVKVSGLSKGKGFQGVVKRHGFAGMPASHGHHHVLRHGGSIGQRFPQHTLKGMRMAGRMGGERVTTRGLKVISVDKENNLLAVKGAVPGRRGTLLEVVKI
ncbi:MAG: 50S ribosomal protein L3 [Patescibacteria group bacterium]